MSRMRPLRRKIRWKRLVVLLILLLTIVTSLSWAAVFVYKKIPSILASIPTSMPTFSTSVDTNKSLAPVSNYINILLLGVDDGDIEYPGAPKRSDTLILASINVNDGKVNLLSIPRDTKVTISGHKGPEKIAHAFFYGGSELTVHTVEELLQIHIQHIVVIDWQAFIKTIDTVGGIDLYVENNMHYEDPYANLVINLAKGYQHLDGSQAGQYVRFRSDELGDIGRVQRQQRFLKAMAQQTLQFGNVFKIPSCMKMIEENITTDLTGWEMFKLGSSLRKFKSAEMSAEILPGNFATVDGFSYWVHNPEQTKQLVDRLFSNDNSN